MNIQKVKSIRRVRRKYSVRKKIYGTAEAPRLSITRSLNNISAQLIDDDKGVTLISASSLDKELRAQISGEMKKSDISKLVGVAIARKAAEKNITRAVFDRNGYLYHGRVKALADGAREAGMII